MVHSKIMLTTHLPPQTPQAHAFSSDFSLMRENTQKQLNSIVEPSKKISMHNEIEPQLMAHLDVVPQVQGYFIEPIEQSETVMTVKKEEEIVITTSETDALYN